MLLKFIVFSGLLLRPLWASETFTIEPASLYALAKEASPQWQQAELNVLSAKFKHAQSLDGLSARLESQASYSETKERAFAPFIPVTSPIETLSFGIVQPTRFGAQFGARAFTEQTTNNFVDKGTTSGIAFELNVDLYRDIFGRLTKNQIKSAELSYEKSRIEQVVQQKQFLVQLQKLYWQLVANEESLKISQRLLKTAVEQEADARKRLKSNISDIGEVARSQSQVAGRKASILFYEYQRESMIQSLKELVPVLAERKVELGAYNIDSAVLNVLACTQVIGSYQTAPMELTPLAKMIELLNDELSVNTAVAQRYGDWDLGLKTEVQKLGKDDGGYSNALDDFSDDGRTAFRIGLELQIPLGSRKKETQDTIEEIERRQNAIQNAQLKGRIHAFHTQISQSIGILNEVIKNQKINSIKLNESLTQTEKKYRQARISFNDLIRDQDSYLQSSLNEVQTKLTVINTILDYFTVFTETPCALNGMN